MMCCPRDGCPPVDGRWRRSSKGRTFGGAVPVRVGCGGGGALTLLSRQRKGGGREKVGWFRGRRAARGRVRGQVLAMALLTR